MSKLILSNNQPRETLWVLDTYLIVGLLPLIVILITASLSSNTYNIALDYEKFASAGTLSTWNKSELSCVLDVVRCTRFPGADESLVLLDWFCLQWNTSTTEFQRSKAGIPSIRRPASIEIITASVELWETHVCFLHIQLIGTNVWHPKNA